MVTQIEQALLRCNGDKFANICRLYLAYKYINVNSSGFALGKEKSKAGIPDNFIFYQGYYIFNEITTQGKGLKNKLKNDIEHCLKQEVIPIKEIAKIILICNSKISPKLDYELREYKNQLDPISELEIIGIDGLANIINLEYPSLGKELGVPIDTGQILEESSFIEKSEKSKFSTPLTNRFFNREKEIEEGIEHLNNKNIILISGQAGVGKTKLALELTHRFIDMNPSYKSKFIVSNGNLDIWQDLKTQIVTDTNYLLVIDDANKIKSNLELIINFLDEPRKGSIKLILTVRNYVKKEVENVVHYFELVELKLFNRDELKNILSSQEFNISRKHFDKIFNISKGNPRIAIMAAKASLHGEIEKLNNASQIHEEYFSTINTTIKTLDDGNLLKVAGVLSLFKAIDIKQPDLVQDIENNFQVTESILIEQLKMLHKYEIADEYKSIYKISDQILGEYIFYITFLKNKTLSFQRLIEIHIGKRTFSLKSVLSPIITNYGFDYVKKLILPEIKQGWNDSKNDESKALNYLKDFCKYIPTETLVYLKNLVGNPEHINYLDLKFESYKDNHLEKYDNQIIDILINFRSFPDKFELSLEILFKYSLSNQILFSKLLKALLQSFTYGELDNETKFSIRIKLFEFLYQKTHTEFDLYSKIIIFIADKYLIDPFDNNNEHYYDKDEDINTVILKRIGFRTKLLEFIFKSYNNVSLKNNVQDFFTKHESSMTYNSYEIANHDNTLIINFFETNFSNKSFAESLIVIEYVSRMRDAGLIIKKNYEKKYISKEYNTWILLNERGEDNKGLIVKSYITYDKAKYIELFEQLEIIKKNKENYFQGWSTILDSITTILVELEKKDFDLFLYVFKEFFNYDFSKSIHLNRVFKAIIYDNCKSIILKDMIMNIDCKEHVKLNFLLNLPDDLITTEDYYFAIEVLKNAETSYIVFIEELVPKLSHLNLDIEAELNSIIDILVIKSIELERFYLSGDFFVFLNDNHKVIFENRLSDLEKIFLLITAKSIRFNYNLDALKLILNIDSDFIYRLLELIENQHGYISSSDLTSYNFSELWSLNNYSDVIGNIFKYFKKKHLNWRNTACEISSIFKGTDIREVTFLKTLLKNEGDNINIRRVFNVILTNYPDLKYEFLKLILKENNSIELFSKLDFYIVSVVYSGSRIPRIKYKISEYEKVIQFLHEYSTIEYLEHINFLEEEITWAKVEIENEFRREFIDRMGS